MTGEGGEPANTDGLQYPMVDLFTGGMILPMVLMNAVRRRATCYGLLHRWRSWTCGRKRLRPREPVSRQIISATLANARRRF